MHYSFLVTLYQPQILEVSFIACNLLKHTLDRASGKGGYGWTRTRTRTRTRTQTKIPFSALFSPLQCRTEAKHGYSFAKVACLAVFHVLPRVSRGQRPRAYLMTSTKRLEELLFCAETKLKHFAKA